MLLAAAASDWVVPNHDAGVAEFDLRLQQQPASSSSSNSRQQQPRCFALKGSYCDDSCRGRSFVGEEKGDGGGSLFVGEQQCADIVVSKRELSSPSFLQRHAYPFLLPALTRWDAARFLLLAHQPQRRKPRQQQAGGEEQRWWQRRRKLDTKEKKIAAEGDDCDYLFTESEQSHAFLPLYPWTIQWTAWALMRSMPASVLPETCEGCLVVAAWLVSSVAFVLATAALYDMTRTNLYFGRRRCSLPQQADYKEQQDEDGMWAERVAWLFILNPASIFFGTAYSESLFAALVFCGGAILSRGLKLAQQRNAGGTDERSNLSMLSLLKLNYVIAGAAIVAAVACWWLATLTRSNGALYFGYMLLLGIGVALRCFRQYPRKSGTSALLFPLVIAIATLVVIAGLYNASMGWHNRRGYLSHCGSQQQQQPDWCSNGPYFNLYSFVQRKHWNVGLFRYYHLKQLPNFLLAAPILVIASTAVATWIGYSWIRYREYSCKKHDSEHTKLSSNWLIFRYWIREVCGWAIYSLQEFATVDINAEAAAVASANATPADILHGPHLLGHYAVLGAAMILGLTIAHIQISTRLICSTCPAVYWHMADRITNPKRPMFGGAIIGYCFLFILLGVTLHSNWLPWT